MNILNHLLLADQGQGGGFSGIFMIVAMVAIFYFFMIRPQSKKQKQIKQAREQLEKGSKVVTAGGIYGKITKISETTFNVEIAPGTEIRIDKNSVYPVVEENDKKGDDKKSDKKADRKADDKKSDKKAEAAGDKK